MRRILMAAVTIVAGTGLALAQDSHDGHIGHDGTKAESGTPVGHDAATMSAASRSYMDAMSVMDREMKTMEMSGKPGMDFAVMMIPHHQAAIDMAKAYLDDGEGDPELVKLSREIIKAQEREIAFLKRWIAERKKAR